jgi:nucleotide sugar dehydrogenase
MTIRSKVNRQAGPKLHNSSGVASVVGLGKIGLPLAVQLSAKLNKVYGVDISETVVTSVMKGISPIAGEPFLEEKLRLATSSKRLAATLDAASAIRKSQFVVVVVPLVIGSDNKPDFASIDSVTRIIGDNLQIGTVVIYETTLPVGTTRKRFGAILEQASGLSMGEGFFLAFSPERVSSGSVFADLRAYPKIVGGINEESALRASAFYEQVLEFDVRTDLPRANGVWNIGTTEAAELTKLMETTYRDVNIALANQFAANARNLGIDVNEVITATNSQPFSHIHRPGISVGGHCIPVYPHFYLEGHPNASLISEARRINKSSPLLAVESVRDALGSLRGRTVAILGLAYRAGVKEHAFSGAIDLVAEIRAQGGFALIHDPLYTEAELRNLGFDSFALGGKCDAVILHTSHPEYDKLRTQDFDSATFFYDGRSTAPESVSKGMPYSSISTGKIGQSSQN